MRESLLFELAGAAVSRSTLYATPPFPPHVLLLLLLLRAGGCRSKQTTPALVGEGGRCTAAANQVCGGGGDIGLLTKDQTCRFSLLGALLVGWLGVVG